MKYLEFETENEAKAFAHRHALEQGEGRLYSRKLRRDKASIEVDDDEGERLPRRMREKLKATREEARAARVKRKVKRTRKQNRKEREARKERRETRG